LSIDLPARSTGKIEETLKRRRLMTIILLERVLIVWIGTVIGKSPQGRRNYRGSANSLSDYFAALAVAGQYSKNPP